MTKDERLQVYKQAEELWGKVAQYDQCVEEMGELIVAINKYKRKVIYGEYKNNQQILDNLIEEVADVKMCIEQMCYFVGEDNVERVLEQKMKKFQRQIDEMKSITKK